MQTKQQKPLTTKEFVIMIIIGLIIWRIPLYIYDLGAIWAGLLPVMGFAVGYWIVLLIRKLNKK